MNKNIKVAKELVKLAKSLVAEQNIADHEGKYENFTGKIVWGPPSMGGASGKVKNATFELKGKIGLSPKVIIWHHGTWINGTWYNGTWEDGQWIDGGWLRGTWKKGYHNNGYWYNGTWEDGNWQGGTWQNGTWKDGYWSGGIWKNGQWFNGTWENGSFKTPKWEKGIWHKGYDAVGNEHDEGDSPNKWGVADN